MSPQENSIAANATAVATHRGTVNQADAASEVNAQWWLVLMEKIALCDRLIHQLCDIRKDSAKERADLLSTRRYAAPVHLAGDIAYLKAEIATLVPAPVEPATGRCIDCASFRRAGLGERCGRLERSLPGEPPLADCLPAHACELFVHWRNP